MKIKKSYDFEKIEDYLKNNFSSPTHWPEWNLLVSKYYGSDFYYFIATDNDEIAGICPVHEEKNGLLRNLYSGQYHYIPYGGWIINKTNCNRNFNLPLKYNHSAGIFSLPFLKEFNNNIITASKTFYTLIVNLDDSLEHIMNDSISYRRRRGIKKALKNNIYVKYLDNCTDEFYKIYLKFNKRKNLSSMPSEMFAEFNDLKNIKVKYIWAYKNDTPLYILVIMYDKNYSFYWLGIDNFIELNIGQGELLHWEAIKYSKQIGCRYYDLCYVEKERLSNIYEFKKGFSNWEVEVPFIIKKPISYKILNKIKKYFRI